MHTRRLKLFVTFVTFIVLFSLQGFSQADEQSAHPLLDKYYPQKKADTSKAVTTTRANAVPETKPVFDATPVPPSKAEIKPVPAQEPVTETKAIPPEPIAETKPALAAKSISETKPVVALKDTTAVNKPVNTPVVIPAQKQIQARPSESLYMDRMGSSSPLYDTYEKNRNGVGSVTTNPK